MNKFLSRIHSIDAFRAVTMFLMIFVNDMEDMPNTPRWIHHASDNADALGLADTIFPAFLFIVGLSIPFALHNRISRGTDKRIPLRIVTRALSLVFIGFYHANMETYSLTAPLPRPVWESLTTISFFLIFLDYKTGFAKWRKYILQGLGVILLIVMSALYRSSDPASSWLHLTWWGILGLIGWSYLVCALIYYYSNGVLWIQAAAWLFFMFFNIDYHYGWLEFLNPIQKYIWISGNGAMQTFTMAGVFVSVLYMRLSKAEDEKDIRLLWIGMILMALILFNLGFIVRYLSGGISKAQDTPSWVLICTAISLIVYALFIYIVDFKSKYRWFKAIRPAGTNTFTCYLVPFIFYPLLEMSTFVWPDYVSQGTGGLIKCLVFAFVMVWLTGLLQKVNIKLKI